MADGGEPEVLRQGLGKLELLGLKFGQNGLI
jgi:hypothetical protein